MKRRVPLAWLQVSRERGRLMAAMAGIAFADMMMFMQLGFRTALYNSNTRLHRSMNADIVLVSPQARNIVNLTTFPRRRLYHNQSFEGVASAEPLYCRPQSVPINIDPDKRNWEFAPSRVLRSADSFAHPHNRYNSSFTYRTLGTTYEGNHDRQHYASRD